MSGVSEAFDDQVMTIGAVGYALDLPGAK